VASTQYEETRDESGGRAWAAGVGAGRLWRVSVRSCSD